MSNPGVLTLTSKQISHRRHFRVEDNLGESIHFHYNDIRIDLTIKELLQISRECDRAIYDLIPEKSFRIEDYEGDFLNRYSHCLIDLIGIEKGEISYSQLYEQRRGLFGLPVVRRESKRTGYPERKETESVILFNDSPVIMGGCLAAGVTETVPFIRMKFKNNRYSVGMHPWIQFLFCWDKKRIWNLMRNIYKGVKSNGD